MTDDGVLATCGGGTGGHFFSDCLIFDPVDVQWPWQWNPTVMGHLPERRGSCEDVTIAGVGTYLLGGYTGGVLSTSAFLPSGSATWQSGPDLPQPLREACAIIYKKSFIVIGV